MTTVTTGPARVFVDRRATLAESIVWDPDHDLIRWTDIPRGTLTTADAEGTVLGTVEVGPPLASFQPRRAGGFVAALADTVVVTDESGLVEREVARVEHRSPGMRFNEGKCDPFGRFLVGSMDPVSGDPSGALYAVEPDGAVRVLRGGFGVTNGIDWSAAGDVMYVTDTAVSTIFAGSYGPDGVLGELRPFVTGAPHDGLVRDGDGCLWTAVYGEGRVERYAPDGTRLEVVDLPVPNVTSVAFGGRDMTTLFVGSAREGLTEEQVVAAPASGAVVAVPTSVRGVPAGRFGG